MLDTLILMYTHGQIIYSKETFFGKKAGESDISLTAGLISAIYSMTQETQSQKIEEIELEDLRYEFRELPGDRLFIITVDKRMDKQDASDILQEIINGFDAKYGDIKIEGKILNDFEPVVDEIVERKLWYNTTPPKLSFMDYIVFLTLLFSVIWYPYWFIRANETILNEIRGGLNLSGLLKVIGGTVLPGLVNFLLLKNNPNMKLPFQYIREFIRRPTRGSYAEGLPYWFLSIPILVIGLTSSVIVSGRGIVYGLTVRILGDGFLNLRPVYDTTGSLLYQGVWITLSLFLAVYFVVTLVIFPVIVGFVSGNLDRNFMKSSIIIVSISNIILLIGHFISGKLYHGLLSYNVEDKTAFETIAGSIEYLFTVTFPINVFIFIVLYFVAISMNSLVKKNKGRFAIGFVFGIFAQFTILDFAFYLMFESGLLGFDSVL